MLTLDIKNFIKKDSLEKYPNECCGLILKNGSVISCTNISEFPEERFMIDNEIIFKYGIDNIDSYYHSHRDNIKFSIADITFSEKIQKPCILYGVNIDSFNTYIPNGYEIPYENRPFFSGFLDCLTLFEDYYRRELNIKVSKLSHPIRFDSLYWVGDTDKRMRETKYKCNNEIQNLIPNYLISNNFLKVLDPKKHDIIEMQSPQLDFPAHISIYLGNNKILTYINKLSSIEIYSGAYKRMTNNIYRHISLL